MSLLKLGHLLKLSELVFRLRKIQLVTVLKHLFRVCLSLLLSHKSFWNLYVNLLSTLFNCDLLLHIYRHISSIKVLLGNLVLPVWLSTWGKVNLIFEEKLFEFFILVPLFEADLLKGFI